MTARAPLPRAGEAATPKEQVERLVRQTRSRRSKRLQTPAVA
jgi:hypothetical protein